MKGAFANASYHNVKFLWQHDSKKSIGIITHLAEDDHGLKMEAGINNKIKAGMVAIELIKQGAIDGLSIGFYIKNSFINYVRKGEDNGLMQKSSLNSNTEAGSVLILQTLYNSSITKINARSPMRQLASIETIATNALDIISEDGKFSNGWIGAVEAREETSATKLKQ